MKARDPVCGMSVETTTAAATSEKDGKTYYFCSESCRKTFEREPEKYVS